MSLSPASKGRTRNRRGEGGLLREEIVAAAERILEREGAEDAVTLRSVAREAGISAPSIYSHFADREAVIDAVLDQAFERLRRLIVEATEGVTDPVDTLLAGSQAYVTFAMAEPARYRVLFGRARALPGQGAGPQEPALRSIADLPVVWQQRLRAFQLPEALAECVAQGRSASTDPYADATMIWTAMHGAVTLRQFVPGFPWPPLVEAVQETVLRLGRIRPDRTAPDNDARRA